MKLLLSVAPEAYQFLTVGTNYLQELRLMYVMVHKGWWPQYLPDISKLVSVRVAMKILSNFL